MAGRRAIRSSNFRFKIRFILAPTSIRYHGVRRRSRRSEEEGSKRFAFYFYLLVRLSTKAKAASQPAPSRCPSPASVLLLPPLSSFSSAERPSSRCPPRSPPPSKRIRASCPPTRWSSLLLPSTLTRRGSGTERTKVAMSFHLTLPSPDVFTMRPARS